MQNEGDKKVYFSVFINDESKGDTDNGEKDTYVPRFITSIPNTINATNCKTVSEIEIHGLTPKHIGAKTKRRSQP